jgi:Holliday junction resolvasome RuvABC endonuclease subunit
MTTLTLPDNCSQCEPAKAATRNAAHAVLGLDLSMTATGVCLPDGTTYTIKTNPKHGDRRLFQIVDEIVSHLGEPAHGINADLAVIEEAPPGLKGPAIKAIHMVHGAVRLRLTELNLPYVEVNPSTLKIYATGNKGADKPSMAVAAFKRAGAEFADDNQCDAWWLRAAGLDHLGHPLFPLPQAQRAALAKATWPELAVTR